MKFEFCVQILRIFNGLRPLRALSRVGLAARPLLLILFKWLFQKQPEESGSRAAVPLTRQLQRSTAGESSLALDVYFTARLPASASYGG